jgi:type VI secretion system protein ImpK
MTPEFAAAVDPLLLEIIALFERVRGGRASEPAEEQATIRAAIDSAAKRVPGTRARDWDLARYALVSLLDDRLIVDLPWSGRSWWEEHCLEYTLYSHRNRAEDFFLRAEDACGLASRDALEVFIAAVLLGFRGRFRDQPAALEAWLRPKEQLVRVGLDRPEVNDTAGELAGALPQHGRTNLVWASLVAALVAAMAVVTVYRVAKG